MIRNYQEEQRIKEKPPEAKQMGVIAAISNGRARLRFSDGITQKYYKMIGTGYTVGNTVKVQKVNGTYIILGII